MKVYVVVNTVEGNVMDTFVRPTHELAVELAVQLIVEQCEEIYPAKAREELEASSFCASESGDIRVTINDCELCGRLHYLKHRMTVRLPVQVTFTTDPAELEGQDKEGEEPPTLRDLVLYLQNTISLDVDVERKGQPSGAVFACSGIEWDKAELIKE